MIRRAKNCSLRYPVTGDNRSVHDQVSRNGWGSVKLFGLSDLIIQTQKLPAQ
jgi:hypothetical protein